MRGFFVVIPTQTIGFYNWAMVIMVAMLISCHTYPNDRLLQLGCNRNYLLFLQVVIPTQTIGFYNCPEIRTLLKSLIIERMIFCSNVLI